MHATITFHALLPADVQAIRGSSDESAIRAFLAGHVPTLYPDPEVLPSLTERYWEYLLATSIPNDEPDAEPWLPDLPPAHLHPYPVTKVTCLTYRRTAEWAIIAHLLCPDPSTAHPLWNFSDSTYCIAHLWGWEGTVYFRDMVAVAQLAHLLPSYHAESLTSHMHHIFDQMMIPPSLLEPSLDAYIAFHYTTFCQWIHLCAAMHYALLISYER